MYTDQTKQNPKLSMPVTNNQNSSIPDCAKCPWNLIATLHLAYRISATFDTRLTLPPTTPEPTTWPPRCTQPLRLGLRYVHEPKLPPPKPCPTQVVESLRVRHSSHGSRPWFTDALQILRVLKIQVRFDFFDPFSSPLSWVCWFYL